MLKVLTRTRARTGSDPAPEQTWYKYLKYVLTQSEPHSLWCLWEDKKIWSIVCRALRPLLGI